MIASASPGGCKTGGPLTCYSGTFFFAFGARARTPPDLSRLVPPAGRFEKRSPVDRRQCELSANGSVQTRQWHGTVSRLCGLELRQYRQEVSVWFTLDDGVDLFWSRHHWFLRVRLKEIAEAVPNVVAEGPVGCADWRNAAEKTSENITFIERPLGGISGHASNTGDYSTHNKRGVVAPA